MLMTRWRPGGRIVAAIAAAAITLAVSSAIAPRVGAQQPRAGKLVFDTVHSAALAHNKFDDPVDREVLVYLPPSYATNASVRYPVVYLLHGFGGTDRTWLGALNHFSIQPAVDSLINAGAAREMIIVMPNGANRLGGSFYTNSATTGNWTISFRRSWWRTSMRSIARSPDRKAADSLDIRWVASALSI
jgi:hypothetical protein